MSDDRHVDQQDKDERLMAVAEKLSALRTEDYFRERAQRGDVAKAKRILKRLGRGNPAVPGDELD